MAYNLLFPYHFINAASMAGTITSPAIEIRNQDNIGIQLDWVGAPVGEFDIQISIDHAQDEFGNITVPGHWISLVLNPAIAAVGSPDDAYADLNQMSASYVRVVYTADSGSGTLNGYITAKGV